MSKGAQTSEVTLPAFQEQMFKDLSLPVEVS